MDNLNRVVSPIPMGMRGMFADPPVVFERDFEEGEARSYVITLNVNERFCRLSRIAQTSHMLEHVKWISEHLAGATLRFYAALANRRIGWCDGAGWIWWEDAYQIAVARLGAT